MECEERGGKRPHPPSGRSTGPHLRLGFHESSVHGVWSCLEEAPFFSHPCSRDVLFGKLAPKLGIEQSEIWLGAHLKIWSKWHQVWRAAGDLGRLHWELSHSYLYVRLCSLCSHLSSKPVKAEDPLTRFATQYLCFQKVLVISGSPVGGTSAGLICKRGLFTTWWNWIFFLTSDCLLKCVDFFAWEYS